MGETWVPMASITFISHWSIRTLRFRGPCFVRTPTWVGQPYGCPDPSEAENFKGPTSVSLYDGTVF